MHNHQHVVKRQGCKRKLTAMSASVALGKGANQLDLADCCRPGEGMGVAEGDAEVDDGKKLSSADDRARVIVGLCGMG